MSHRKGFMQGLAGLVLGTFASGAFAQAVLLGVLGGANVGADDAGALVRIDQATGAATVLGTPLPGRGLTGLAADSAGLLFATSDENSGTPDLIQINPTTGALINNVGTMTFAGNPVSMNDIAIHPATGVIYGSVANGAGLNSNDLVTINRTTAVVTLIGTPPYGGLGGYAALAFAPDGTLWAKPTSDGYYATVNPATAAIITSNTTTIGGLGIAIHPVDGRMLIAECCTTLGNDIFSLNTTTAVATLLGPAGGNRRVHDLAFVGAPAPAGAVAIPSMNAWGLALMALLLAMAATFAMRRTR
jgi:hypothetical protein